MKDTPQSLLEDVKNNIILLYDVEPDYIVSLLKYSENIIYKVEFKSSQPVVFRIHRPGYHNIEELEGEIRWMYELHKSTDVELPVVYRGRDGGFLQKMHTSSGEDVYCSVISFLNGSPLGELEGESLLKGMQELGRITAKLHIQSISRDKTIPIKRFSWDINNLFGDNGDGIWGSWRDYKGMTSGDYRIIEKCTEDIKKELNHYGRDDDRYGLIHADLHFYNVINDNGKNQIIDFDDCGYGFYMYDIGCALVTYSQDLEELENAWIKGYETIRKLSLEDKRLIPMFVLTRRITRLAWLSTHSDSDTAKMVEKDYLKVTVDMAREWLLNNTKVAIVTGAASGIGYGIAKKLCEAGCRIALIGRSESVYEAEDKLKRYADAVGSQYSTGYSDSIGIKAYQCDITRKYFVIDTVESIIKDFGKIDILINNAGVAKINAFEETEDEQLDMHIDTNIKGTWNMTKAVITYMKKRNYGRIINMSSVTGLYECDKGYSAYATTKAALIGFTKAVAAEYAEYGITCNAVCPGFILTPNVLRSATTTNPDNPQEVIDKIACAVPVNRLGTPEQIGSLLVFLSGDDADYITGTDIVIDGGNMIPETSVMGL